MAFVEILVTSVVLFFLYRFLLDYVGIEVIGVWSLVLAATSFGNLAGFGFPRSLVYFLPRLIRGGQRKLAVLYIETAVLSIGGFITLLCLLLYFPLYHVLATVIDDPNLLDLGRDLLPWAMISLILVNISYALNSAVKGLQLNFLSSFIVIISNAVYFVLSILLVPRYGIMATAWAQVTQAGLTLLLSLLVTRRHLPLPYWPRRLSRRTFRKIASYGFKAQYIALVVLFLQPLTKYLLGAFSTLEMVGYYEFALKFVQNVGKMITNANNALTSTFSLYGKDKTRTRELYLNANRITWMITPVMMGGLLALTPAVSELWIGHYSEPFTWFTLIIGGSTIVSVMASPSYSMGMGAGLLRTNLIGQTVIALANLALGAGLGWLYGGYGVAIGTGLALILGNLVIISGNSRAVTGLAAADWRLTAATTVLLACTVAGVMLSQWVYDQHLINVSVWLTLLSLGSVFTAMILVPTLIHPGFKTLLAGVKRKRHHA